MQVSVIIPVYNAEDFVAAAVKSALAQPETGEVLLIDDGSTDESYAICRELAKDPRVFLLSHPDHMNRGVSASRNLGLDNAKMPYLAFLDADDVYLPDRFTAAAHIFGSIPEAEGVYETAGARYTSEEAKARHLKRMTTEDTGLRIASEPSRLFRNLAKGKHGHIILDALVLKRSVIDSGVRFDSALPMSEDVDFILRLACKQTLYTPSERRVVALRGVHDNNTVFTNPNALLYRRRYLQKCIDHDFYGSPDFIAAMHIINRRVGASVWYQPFKKLGKAALPFKIWGVLYYVLIRPALLGKLLRRLV